MSAKPVITTLPELGEAIVDTKRWSDQDWVERQFAWMREHAPVVHLKPDGFVPFWSITRHQDIYEIESDKALWINDPRPILMPNMLEALVAQVTGRRHLIRSLITMDAPDHIQHRVLTQKWFMRSNIQSLKKRVNSLANEYVDKLIALEGECDFVRDVAQWFPLRVIMEILGVPKEDEPLMLKLTQELFGGSDPDIARSFEISSTFDVWHDFETYFNELTEKRRSTPNDDVGTVIANGTIRGEEMAELERNSYYTIIATAGHDTTSATIAGGLLALIQNPDQLQALRLDPDGLMDSAVEEMVRWVAPVRQFMRTATRDCEVGGVKISAGEACVLWYLSACRDESVFDDPSEFKIDRDNRHHLAFGHGAHVCLGQHLARLEISLFFKQLLPRIETFELAGPPQYKQAAFVGGLKRLPIRYSVRELN